MGCEGGGSEHLLPRREAAFGEGRLEVRKMTSAWSQTKKKGERLFKNTPHPKEEQTNPLCRV